MVGNWRPSRRRIPNGSGVLVDLHAGYLLLGLVAGNEYGYMVWYYLLVYTLMNMGAFGVIISLRRRGIMGDNVDDMTVLVRNRPHSLR